MRLNQFLARHTHLSRRGADKAITDGRVRVNEHIAHLGAQIEAADTVELDNHPVIASTTTVTILLHKPIGYVCSRDGQGNKTIYHLLPYNLQHLNPVGRLDKNSSGLLLLTNDGKQSHQLTHPSFQKNKIYVVALDKPLSNEHKIMIEKGVLLDDGISRLKLNGNNAEWKVTMHEGRNRQIRRTFSHLGYDVLSLKRVQFGPYTLSTITPGKFEFIKV
jgi:23S rRNA pseudouridine2605 synthase